MAEASRGPLPAQSRVFFYIILAAVALLLWIVFKPFVIVTVTGVFVAVLALPIDRFWERLFPNRLAAFFTMFTLFLIIFLPLFGIGFALFNDAEDLAQSIQSGDAERWLDEQLDNPVVQDALDVFYPDQTPEERNATIEKGAQEVQSFLFRQLTEFGKSLVELLPRFFIGLTVILFVVYYVLTDGHRLVGYFRRVSPLPPGQFDFLVKEAHNGLHAVFVGQILTSVIQGAIGGIGFLIAGLPAPVLWASVMAVLSLLPVIGAFVVWIPAAIFLLVTGEIWQGVFLLIWGFVVVSQVDNFVRPRLIGNRAKIHPIFVLIGVLGGVAAFGFIGLFLGPLLVGVAISVLKVWETHYLDPGLQDSAFLDESE